MDHDIITEDLCANCPYIDQKTNKRQCEITGSPCEDVEEILNGIYNAEPDFAEVPYPEHTLEYIIANTTNTAEWARDMKYMPEQYKQALSDILEHETFLTSKQRVALWLHVVDGLPYVQVAKLMRKQDPETGKDIGHIHWTAVRASVMAALVKLRRYVVDQTFPSYRECAHIYCDVKFKIDNPSSTRKYCSSKCRWAAAKLRKYRRKKAKNPKIIREAINCANPACDMIFVPIYKNQIYHARKCRTEHYNIKYSYYCRPWLTKDGSPRKKKNA